MLIDITIEIRNPPIFNGELNRVLLAFIRYRICSESSLDNKRPVLIREIRLNNELSLFYFNQFKTRYELIKLIFIQGNKGLNVLDKLIFLHLTLSNPMRN